MAMEGGGESVVERTGERVLCVSMNQDHSLFALGTTCGFRVYNTWPLKHKYGRDWGSGVGIVELYLRTNVLALVGGGPVPRFSTKALTVWDDFKNRVIAEVDFYAEITAIRMHRDRIVVALPTSVEVLNFSDLQVIVHCPATMTPLTLALSPASERPVVAFAAASTGPATTRAGLLEVRRDSADAVLAAAAAAAAASATDGVTVSASGTGRDVVEIQAHNGPLACVALSDDGTLAATASDKGTLVRVWDTAEPQKMVKELRRGADHAQIWCMCFSKDKSLLAVSSSRGTCHIYGLAGLANKQSSLRSFRSVLPAYFSSEWSSMQVSVPPERSIMAFSDDKTSLFMVFYDGTYRRIELQWGATPTAKLDPTIGTIDLLRSG